MTDVHLAIRALATVNMSDNMIRAAGAQHLFGAIVGHPSLDSLDVSGNEIGAYYQNNRGIAPVVPSPEGPAAIADGLKKYAAMTKLNVSANHLLNKESGKALADALKENSTLRELDASNNYYRYESNSSDGPGFAQELAVGVAASGAITRLDLRNNNLGGRLSWNKRNREWLFDPSGITALAAAIPECK